jgi:hypothetical protein
MLRTSIIAPCGMHTPSAPGLAAEHGARLGGLIDQRVRVERDSHEHDYNDRPQAGHGGASAAPTMAA